MKINKTLQQSIDEWGSLLYAPEKYEWVTYAIPNDIAERFREIKDFPSCFYKNDGRLKHGRKN